MRDLPEDYRAEHCREEDRGERVRGREPPVGGRLPRYLEGGSELGALTFLHTVSSAGVRLPESSYNRIVQVPDLTVVGYRPLPHGEPTLFVRASPTSIGGCSLAMDSGLVGIRTRGLRFAKPAIFRADLPAHDTASSLPPVSLFGPSVGRPRPHDQGLRLACLGAYVRESGRSVAARSGVETPSIPVELGLS